MLLHARPFVFSCIPPPLYVPVIHLSYTSFLEADRFPRGPLFIRTMAVRVKRGPIFLARQSSLYQGRSSSLRFPCCSTVPRRPPRGGRCLGVVGPYRGLPLSAWRRRRIRHRVSLERRLSGLVNFFMPFFPGLHPSKRRLRFPAGCHDPVPDRLPNQVLYSFVAYFLLMQY